MKLAKYSYALLLFAAVGLFSCSDDDKPTSNNKISIGESTSKITKGVFLKDVEPGHDDNNNEIYNNELAFLGEGVTVTTSNGEVVATAQGTIMSLLFRGEGRTLDAGTYTWQEEEHNQAFDLWAAYLSIDWNTETQIDYEFGSGTFVVTKSGNKYTVTFEGVAHLEDGDGEVVPGSELNVSIKYEGSFLEIDREF